MAGILVLLDTRSLHYGIPVYAQGLLLRANLFRKGLCCLDVAIMRQELENLFRLERVGL